EEAIAALRRLGFRPLAEEFTTWNTPRCTQPLDLRIPEEELWQAVRRRFREYVKSAGRKRLLIEDTDREEDLATFYRLLVNVARMKEYPIRAFSYYQSLFRRYREAGTLTLLRARRDDTILGGLLAVRLARRSFLLYTSVRSEEETLKHHVSPALYWEYIRRAKAQGCERADFGPSGVHLTPLPSDSGYGVYRFKTAFGCGTETYAPFHDLVFRPMLYRALRLGETLVLPKLWELGARATPPLRRVLSPRRRALAA
ncbi:MAG: lipid II:glycine glycyltransferase FemX, partial [Candidatus Rokuibacteriota bacterium]